MKRILTFVAVILLGLTLVACKGETSSITVAFTDLDVELTSMMFSIELNDPNAEITGAVTLTLYAEDDRVAYTKDITDFAQLNDYQIAGLNNETTYTLKLFATVGRKVVTLFEREIQLASTEIVHITTAEEFLAMSNNRAGNYVLDNDIDFTDVTFQTPFVSPFSGTFDGQGHTLKNIKFNSIIRYTGVFGYVSTGIIKNVTLDQITIGTAEEPLTMTSSSVVGIVAGYISAATGTIKEVEVTNSMIHYTTSSTVQAYVGGLVGESKGVVQSSTLENTVISLKSTSYGRIRVGGAVGLVQELSKLNEVIADVDLDVEIAGTSIKDRNIFAYVGGLAGTIARDSSVNDNIASGNISVDLDFGTIDGTTEGSYSIYIGGISGVAYSNPKQMVYSGSITLNHTKNAYETEVDKSFFVGGLYGVYQTSKISTSNLRYSDLASIILHVSDDVTLKASQTVAQLTATGNTFSYYGDLGLMINDTDETLNDDIDVVLTLDEFFDSEIIDTWLSQK